MRKKAPPAWATERARELTPLDLVVRDHPRLVAWNTSTTTIAAVLACLRAGLRDE